MIVIGMLLVGVVAMGIIIIRLLGIVVVTSSACRSTRLATYELLDDYSYTHYS